MGIQIARAAVLLLAAALRLWRLNQNGYDNEYYAAAVRSMASGWHAFLYNAFDPTGFVSVDKPPVALWLQALSVKLFGFHGLTVLLPQVAEGVAAVALLDYLVRRRLGARAGVLAGLFLAVMPVSVATDRSNNTESCLVLVLLLAAWALLAAAERGSRWLLLLSGVLISLGFTTSCSWRRPWPRWPAPASPPGRPCAVARGRLLRRRVGRVLDGGRHGRRVGSSSTTSSVARS